MDAALLPEISEGVTGGYLAGLRDGGWTGPADTVRTAIAACGAAKYSWFGPAVIRSAVRDDAGQTSCRAVTPAAALVERLTGVVTLIAQWAAAVPDWPACLAFPRAGRGQVARPGGPRDCARLYGPYP